jgi:hypothetical protein
MKGVHYLYKGGKLCRDLEVIVLVIYGGETIFELGRRLKYSSLPLVQFTEPTKKSDKSHNISFQPSHNKHTLLSFSLPLHFIVHAEGINTLKPEI